MVLRHALAQVRTQQADTQPTRAPICLLCGIQGRPLFAGVCTPCEDHDRRMNAHDEGRAYHGLGRSRAAVWRQMNPNE